MVDWTPWMHECAPQVAAATLQAIVKVESAHNPLALNVNGYRLARQPRDEREAQAWLRWLMARGHSVDVGLMQVNTANFGRLGLTPQNAFDPCRNLAAGAAVLQEAYRRARARRAAANTDPQADAQAALRQAVSAYNTGNAHAGFRNGYVARVVAAAREQKRETLHGQ